ncbi:MAG: DUF721 domain-containing protein [Myxococcales bacterium]|nr:DUF721 domain-containing protein [Myxococcales bacterium]
MQRQRPEDAPAPLDDLVARLLRGLARHATDPLQRARMAWPRACGPQLARHTTLIAFVDGTLQVGAYGPHWREACFQHRRELLSRLRRAVPGLQRLELRTLPQRPAAPRTPAPPPPPADPRTEDVDHAGLRGALDALLAATPQSRP